MKDTNDANANRELSEKIISDLASEAMHHIKEAERYIRLMSEQVISSHYRGVANRAESDLSEIRRSLCLFRRPNFTNDRD